MNQKILEILKEDSRSNLISISEKVSIPVSKVYDEIQEIRRSYRLTIEKL